MSIPAPSLPPIPPGQWFWGKGTPAGGLRAWLEQLRTSTYTKAEIDALVASGGTSGSVTSTDNGNGTITLQGGA